MRRAACILLLVAGCSPQPPAPPPDMPRGWRGEMLDRLNDRRAGLAPVALSKELSQACQAHSAAMARAGRLYHAPGVVEVIAMGQRSPAEAIDSWMRSTVGHRQALLDWRWRAVGFGAAKDGRGTWYWTARFE